MNRNQHGCIHIYCGDGKGKTTAAIGLCIRAIGNDIPIRYVQFLKDGSSGEIHILRKLSGVEVDYEEQNYGFFSTMTEETKRMAAEAYSELLWRTIETCKKRLQTLPQNGNSVRMMLILDEVIASYNYGLIDKELLLTFLTERPDGLEIIMTGRNPAEELMQLADYISEIQKKKHPYEKGLPARKGIEK